MALIQKAFSDIITFSRSSNATRVGPTGVLEYAPHNLVTYSEQFDNAAWTIQDGTVSPNSAASPNGTVTADKVIINNGASGGYIYRSASGLTAGISYTQSIYLKADGFSVVNVLTNLSGSYKYIRVNLLTGVISQSGSDPLPTSYYSVNIGNGWWRIVVTETTSGTSGNVLYVDNNGSTGDGVKGFLTWGAQLAVGPYALDYTPTTSAAVYGPRFDYDGSGVTIVEPVSRNLVTYSEDFGNAAWNKNNATVSTNTTISPDGQTTADTLTEDTSVSEHFTNQQTSKTATNIQYTFSAYVKRGTSGTRNVSVAITDGTTGGYEAVFDPDDGAILVAARGIASTTGWTAGAATATNAGNGWWRFAFTVTTNTSTRADGILYLVNGTTNSYTGNGSSNLFVWGAQLEVGSTATAYMVSGASNGFRAVPVVSGSATPKGLLVEEQRQNLVTYSEQFDNAAWNKQRVAITANAATSPDGTVSADLMYPTSADSNNEVWRGISVTSGAQYAMSVFAKQAGKSFLALGVGDGAATTVFFNLANGTVGDQGAGLTGSIVAFGNGWYRCTVIATASSTSMQYTAIVADANGSTAVTVNGTNGIYIWGAQLEAGSFATSLTPTLASAVTRTADVASVNTLSPWWNGTEGTFLFDFNQVGTASIAAIGDDTFNNSLRFNVVNMARGNGTGFANLVTLGTSQNGSHKLAVAMKVNDYAGSFDGGAVSTQTTASMVPASNVLGIGRDYGTNGYMNGWMRRLAFYPRRLTNAELQALTA